MFSIATVYLNLTLHLFHFISIVHFIANYIIIRMLHNKFFHRAKKVPINEELLKGKKKGAKDEKDKKPLKEDKDKKDGLKEKKKKDDGESSHAEGKGQEVRLWFWIQLLGLIYYLTFIPNNSRSIFMS